MSALFLSPGRELVLGFKPLSWSQNSNPFVLAEDEKVFVARNNKICFAGDCRGEHGDVIGITADIGIKWSRFEKVGTSFIGAEKGNILCYHVELLLELLAEFIQKCS